MLFRPLTICGRGTEDATFASYRMCVKKRQETILGRMNAQECMKCRPQLLRGMYACPWCDRAFYRDSLGDHKVYCSEDLVTIRPYSESVPHFYCPWCGRFAAYDVEGLGF